MRFLSKHKTLSCLWVAIPVDCIILYWYTCGANGRSVYGHVITHGAPLRGLRARELRSAGLFGGHDVMMKYMYGRVIS